MRLHHAPRLAVAFGLLVLAPACGNAADPEPRSAAAAELETAIAAAKPGQTITAKGRIGDLLISDRNWSPAITLDLTGATLNNLRIQRSSGVHVHGGEWVKTAQDWRGAIYVIGSSDVRISDVSTSQNGLSPGVTFRESHAVGLEGARIDRASVGMDIRASTDVTVRNVQFVGSAIDGIDIAGSHDVLIDFIGCMGNLLIDTSHPDCVQLWSLDNAPPTSNITVQNSVAFGATQGFTAFDETHGVDNVTFQNNLVVTSYPQGLALYGARNSRAVGNVVRTLPNSKWRTTINIVRSPTSKACGNVIAGETNEPEAAKAPCRH